MNSDMKNKLKSIFLFFAVGSVLGSCFKDPGTDLTLKNAAVVEIQEATTNAGIDVSKSYNKVPGGPTTIKDSIQVNFVGAPRSTPINVSFTVDAVIPSPGIPAVPGIHYDMITTGTVTIPANANRAWIYFNVHPQVFNPGEVFKFRVMLTGADVPLSSLYSVFIRSLRISCPWARTSFIGTYNALEPGYGTYPVIFTADATDPFTVVNSNFWDVGAVVKYVFNTAGSGSVSIPSQTFVNNCCGAGPETLTVASAAGSTYDACIGKFVVPYTVKRANGSTIDSNTHTFTKP
jgi:hypothetical protein